MSNADATLEDELSRDPLHKMRVYQLARALRKEAWDDAEKLKANRITAEIAGQLYRAVGSIKANLAEGYSRSSGRDRAKMFEYSLGSARETIEWYDSALPVLGEAILSQRQSTLLEIRKLLLAMIPRERDRLIRKA